MKKRIIGLILVIAMLTLSLVSCGYSFAKSDLSSFATFSEEDKAALLAAIAEIKIEDGDFTADPETREKKVLDNIYAALANASKDGEKKTTGVPGARDLVYYCYYATTSYKADENSEEKVVVLFASSMKQANAVGVQLGAGDHDSVESAVAEVLKDYDFGNGVYTSTTSGKTAAGDIAYVTYTTSYTAEGASSPTTTKYTNSVVVIGEAVEEGETATSFASYLNGKSIASSSSIDKITINEDGKEITYSGITINWVAKGEKLAEFKDVTYTEEKNVSDTTGLSIDLNGKELTYYIYPVYYQNVSEFNATNIIEVLLGEDITADAIYEMVLGEEYANLDEKEDAEKIEERATLLKDYVTADGQSIDMIVTKLATLYSEISEAEESLDEAETDLSEATDTRDEAKKKVDEAGDAVTEELTEALSKAESNLTKATQLRDQAKTLLDDKVADKDAKISAFLEITVNDVKMDTKLVQGYKTVTYNYLQSVYNDEIKMNLAKEVYYFLTKSIEVTGTPEKAVEQTYNQIIDNYKYDFYNEQYDSTNKISNYKQYSGSFKKFLIAAVTEDIEKVETYDAALAAVREKASEYVEPIVRIYVASKAYGVLATDKEYEEYKSDTDNNYSYNEYSYGENSVLYAYQFDKLMNFFLESEEQKAENPDANGYTSITYKYTRVSYVFGEPESEKTETTEE